MKALNSLIEFSLKQRAFIVILAIGILFVGVRVSKELPVDVLPDLTKPTVTIIVEASGYAPEEIETLITVPLESSLMGVSGLTRLRTTSDVGIGLIFLEFDWGTDIYQARQFVQERLTGISEELPEGISPYMTPASSLLGEIMLLGVTDTSGKLSPPEVRTLTDWVIRKRIQSVPGISEVLAMGGGIQQIQIQPNPEKMRLLKITYAEIESAAKGAVKNSTGGFITNTAKEVMIRNLSMTTDLDAISKTVVRYDASRPITLSDVATVKWDVQPLRGDAAVNGHMGSILSITKSPGFDTLALTEEVEHAIKELEEGLPEGVVLTPVYRQADFIELSIGNLEEAIRDGAIMVSVILLLFLMNLRITFITLTAIPLSLTMSLIVF